MLPVSVTNSFIYGAGLFITVLFPTLTLADQEITLCLGFALRLIDFVKWYFAKRNKAK